MNVGIVGSGTMGSGIAVAFANAGNTVTIVDTEEAALERGAASIDRIYRSFIERGTVSPEEAQECRNRIDLGLDLRAFADAEIVVEAAFENLEIKRDVFSLLGDTVSSDAILATNTSTLDIDAITEVASNPERSLGMHFFSPAHVMRLVEVVRGTRTSPETVERVVTMARSLGKIPVVVGNCDGFVGNRMLLRYRREMELLLEAGATPQQVDAALRAFGFAMGPFAVADLAGLDIAYKAKQERTQRGGLPFRQSRIPDMLVEAGRLGQKTRAGYYKYNPGDRMPWPDEDVAVLIAAEREHLGVTPRNIQGDEITKRATLALFSEGARILRDGIAGSESDIDTIWVNGYGFPVARSGPMAYARSRGRDAVRHDLEEFAREDATFWDPSLADAIPADDAAP
jgi:3-hydroxyacyl-CoA dehydrogenase